MVEKKYGPGTQLPNTRLNKKTPQYVLDYLEKHQPKSADLMRLIQLGIEVELNREQYGLFIPYAPLSKEQIRELETNEMLKAKFMQFAKWFFFTEGNEPPPFVSATVKSTESMAVDPVDSKNTSVVTEEKQMDEEQWLLTNEYMHLAMQHLDDDDD